MADAVFLFAGEELSARDRGFLLNWNAVVCGRRGEVMKALFLGVLVFSGWNGFHNVFCIVGNSY